MLEGDRLVDGPVLLVDELCRVTGGTGREQRPGLQKAADCLSAATGPAIATTPSEPRERGKERERVVVEDRDLLGLGQPIEARDDRDEVVAGHAGTLTFAAWRTAGSGCLGAEDELGNPALADRGGEEIDVVRAGVEEEVVRKVRLGEVGVGLHEPVECAAAVADHHPQPGNRSKTSEWERICHAMNCSIAKPIW